MQSAAEDPAKRKVDSSNKLRWRHEPYRLDAEAIRDSILPVSGQLSPEMFGKTVPLKKAPDGQFVVDTSEQPDNGRSIYLLAKRTEFLDFLAAFDFPRMESNASARFRSSVPRQSLALMDSPFMVNAAEKLLDRVTAGAETTACAASWRLTGM